MNEKKHDNSNCLKTKLYYNIIKSKSNGSLGHVTREEIVKYYKTEKRFKAPKFLEKPFNEIFYGKKFTLVRKHVEYYKEFDNIQGRRAKCNSL